MTDVSGASTDLDAEALDQGDGPPLGHLNQFHPADGKPTLRHHPVLTPNAHKKAKAKKRRARKAKA